MRIIKDEVKPELDDEAPSVAPAAANVAPLPSWLGRATLGPVPPPVPVVDREPSVLADVSGIAELRRELEHEQRRSAALESMLRDAEKEIGCEHPLRPEAPAAPPAPANVAPLPKWMTGVENLLGAMVPGGVAEVSVTKVKGAPPESSCQYYVGVSDWYIDQEGMNCSYLVFEEHYREIGFPRPFIPAITAYAKTRAEAIEKAQGWIRAIEENWDDIRARADLIRDQLPNRLGLGVLSAKGATARAPEPFVKPSAESLFTRFEKATLDLLHEYETTKNRGALELACRAHEAMIRERDDAEYQASLTPKQNGRAPAPFEDEGIFFDRSGAYPKA